ncbi:hypothetical protein BJ6T_79480 [Bradyrhizobium japonicum USDA 6]|nr:hypothetical protein BJ6T_79480 [Bradyrhizobium japonicum USDA 6]
MVRAPQLGASQVTYRRICGEGSPAVDLAHVDLAGGEQARTALPRRPLMANGLDLDPSLELLTRPLNCVGSRNKMSRRQLPLRCSTARCMVLPSAQRQREREWQVRRRGR